MPDVFTDTPQPEQKRAASQPRKTIATLQPPPGTNRAVTMFTAFSQFPDPAKIRFENQEDNEQIRLFLRRHLASTLPWLVTTIICTPLPFFIFFMLAQLNTPAFTIPPNFTFILLLFYYLILFGYAFINFLTWFYNVGIITNLRAVDIDISHITHKNVASTELADIVDVEYNQSGFLSNMLDYGDIHLQTEGVRPNFEYLFVPHPAKVADVISDLIREARE